MTDRQLALAPSAATYCEAPGALGAAIRALARDVRVERHPSLLAAAQAHLARVGSGEAPATAEAIGLWLADLADMGLAGTPRLDAELAQRIRAIAEVCEDLPAAVWARPTRLAFAGMNHWWPSPAELRRFLEPFGDALRRQCAGCRAILAPVPPGELARHRTPEEHAAVRAQVAALDAEMAARRDERRERAPIARTRTDERGLVGVLRDRAQSPQTAIASAARKRLQAMGVRWQPGRA